MHLVWWLVSRASGVVALVLVSLSVLIGLAMAAKLFNKPGRKRALVRWHEYLALIALVAIATHGLALLGDGWLKPGLRGISVPFALGYRPGFTGIGIIAGYLAVLLGPSFYLRRRIGARRWRKLHRATVLIWLLSAVHAIGAGSDATALWLRCVVLAPVAPIAYLLALRMLGRPASARPVPSRQAAGPARESTGAARSVNPHSHSAPIETAAAASEVATIPRSGSVSAKNVRVAGISSAPT
jgi:methionine sulfoxide reductase heme-binding subunit